MEQLDFHEVWWLSIFRKSVEKNQIWLHLTRIAGTSHVDICKFMISRAILLTVGNVSDKYFRENHSTQFIFKNFFPRKSCRVWDNVEKYCRAGQATDDNIIRNMRIACRITKAADTHSEYTEYLLLFHWNNGYAKEPQRSVYAYIACIFTLCIIWRQLYLLSSSDYWHIGCTDKAMLM
jgi:hypothetical protein